MKDITTGKSIVQEKDISWSKRILGKEALTHMKIKTIIQDLIPIIRPDTSPSTKGIEKNSMTSIKMCEKLNVNVESKVLKIKYII